MIDIQLTMENFGYDPRTLSPGSNRVVVNVCPACGGQKNIRYHTTTRGKWSGLCSTCKPKTSASRKNRSDYMMGNKLTYECGLTTLLCDQCGREFKVKRYRANKEQINRFCSKQCEGLFRSGDNNYFYGKHFSGEAHPNWKGGVSSEDHLMRTSQEYKGWRQLVFDRDDYTCQECGKRGGDMNAHHILPYRDHGDIAFDINNGITLCVKCHRKTYNKEYQFVKKYLKILGFFAQKCAFINRVNSGDTSSETILSQAYPETDLKVQRLTAESTEDGNADTSALHPQLDDDIV